MLDEIAGTYGSRLFVAAGGVAAALLVLVAILWLVRNRAPSPFVRGGKGRQQRLQVLDAAAIDARRRIVLIRRDGVEHLVMIGGPTDIVIESGIGDTSRIAAPAQPIASAPPVQTITAPEPAPRQLEASTEPSPIVGRRREPAALSSPPPAPPVPTTEIERPAAAVSSPVAAPEPRQQFTPLSPTPGPEVETAYVAPRDERPLAASAPVQAMHVEPVVFERQAEADAADILDAARSRVLPAERTRDNRPASAREVMPSAPAPAPMLAQDAYSESYEVPTPEVAQPRKLGSDFERVLEAEMTSNLTAERVVQPIAPPPSVRPELAPRPEPVPPQQRRDPDMAPVVGGDAALQKEVARIFGEMSVNREK
ncbi:flagellar biosynthetic protein FliO [Rhizobium tumorigenes]|uniref:Flagellar biosynthetic protein FliO n=1 Tax=Rhizobium tumorigenes TaxID=2041385 RepID=A0AAF1K6Q4_9HYPH|nr:flagellar biosynthetic protein FliO [Rhizobium tumorigenes]WFR96974.1 flagellar biosynthetic protein FliO [Rhizobium tumorigenes]